MSRKNYQSMLGFVVLALWLVVALEIISPAASAAYNSNPRIQQGQTVHVNDIIDISGVVAPYPQLAYWDGYNMYDSTPTYIITLPINRSGWYNFYVDPTIFAPRLGNWYKYDSTIGFESHGDSLAFVVARQDTPQVTSAAPTNIMTAIVTPVQSLSIPSSPIPTQTIIITPTPTPRPIGKGEAAGIISILIVGLVFGLFTLYESKWWDKK